MKNIFSWIFKKLPLWSYGIECSICQMTFISPEAHYSHVISKCTESKHKNKIPKL